jgi:flagellin
MSLTVNTNIASLTAQRNLVGTNRSLQTSMARLSSGLRINSAKDDAAGLAISDKMTAQIRGMNQAVRNANDAISLAQTAEGAMQEMTNLLQRMRELAVQSANDTYGSTERGSLDDEYQALALEITRISDNAEFNGTKLLDGSVASLTFQVGANDSGDNQIVFTMPTAMDAATLMGAVGDITDQANSLTAIGAVDTALATVDQNRGDLGAIQSRLESTVSNLMNVSENVSAARSRIMDADFAAETANLTRAQILQQAGVAMLSQANAIPQTALALLQ